MPLTVQRRNQKHGMLSLMEPVRPSSDIMLPRLTNGAEINYFNLLSHNFVLQLKLRCLFASCFGPVIEADHVSLCMGGLFCLWAADFHQFEHHSISSSPPPQEQQMQGVVVGTYHRDKRKLKVQAR